MTEAPFSLMAFGDNPRGFLTFCDINIYCLTGKPFSLAIEAHNNFPTGKVYTEQ